MAELSYIVVEDDEEFVFLLNKYLEKIPDIKHLGTYGGTTDAVRFIERDKPDLIFLDINISGLDGPDFVDLLDEPPKVIVISGHEEGVMENYDIEYVAFIQKPPSMDVLKEAIEKCR